MSSYRISHFNFKSFQSSSPHKFPFIFRSIDDERAEIADHLQLHTEKTSFAMRKFYSWRLDRLWKSIIRFDGK